MDVQSLKYKVLILLDEVDMQPNDIADRYNIEEFLISASYELMQAVPLSLMDNVMSFSVMELMDNGDGTGKIKLPSDFMRLVEFKMQGWSRSVIEPVKLESVSYSRQKNKYARGGISKPVVAIRSTIEGRVLEYYSLKDGDDHVVESALYLPHILPENVPAPLIEILCVLTASYILSVANEVEGAKYMYTRYSQMLSQL